MASQKNVLVVEDEADLASLVQYNLEREGYACRRASDGGTALAEVQRQKPDLIVLDRMLPGMSGDQFAAKLKREPGSAAIPIIMLTAKAEETDELVGFALGADDYITKPFSMKKLLARVAAVLRRAEGSEAPPRKLESEPFMLDLDRHELTVGGEPVTLTATEFKIFKALMASKGRVLSRSQLIDFALGTGAVVTDRTIDVHITALRKKLAHPDKTAADWIHTIRGVGYAFRAP